MKNIFDLLKNISIIHSNWVVSSAGRASDF